MTITRDSLQIRSPFLQDSKRKAILRGARSVFLANGFGRASMDAVASEAGVSKMTVYRHYGSKEALFAGVIDDLCSRIVRDDLGGLFASPARQALADFAAKMIEITFAKETIELHRIVVAESVRFPELGRLFYRAGPEACISALEQYFARNRSLPGFKIGEPRRSAEEFLELLRGYAHLRVLLGLELRPTKREIETRIENAIRHVFELGPKRPRPKSPRNQQVV